MYKVQFRARYQRRNEDPDEFTESLSILARRAFPQFPQEAIDSLVMDRFKEGQSDSELKQYLSLSPAGLLHCLIGDCNLTRSGT